MRGTGLNPGWLVALCAAVLSVSVWLPWRTRADPASAISGADGTAQFGVGQVIALFASVLLVAGAMVARRIFPALAASGAIGVSVVLVGAESWFYRLAIGEPSAAGYAFYLGVAATVAALVCSLWALAGLRTASPS